MKTLYSASGLELTSELAKYANSKTAHLAKKIPRSVRSAAVCNVSFSQILKGTEKTSTCRITLTLGDTALEAEEATQHMYAALDIAVVYIEQQIEEYTRTHRRRLLRSHKAID
jgi:putative sigma-54 modulation protein